MEIDNLCNHLKVSFIKRLISYYLYLSIHIGLCAAALSAFSYLSIDRLIDWDYVTFIGISTSTLYNLHRLIGLKRIDKKNGRFEIISTLNKPLQWISILGIVMAAYLFMTFDFSRQLRLLLPCAMSLAYILPILPYRKRFRDLPFAKGILLALAWAALTISIPFYEIGISINLVLLYSIERFLFIFAMGMSFDIRDMSIDRAISVKTIPNVFGRQKSIWISIVCLLVATVLAYLIYGFNIASIITLSYFVGTILVVKSTEHRSDIYYGFWVDLVVGLPLIVYIIFYALTN